MQKIHRRKNEQISKDFVCTYGCGKAYGSYAALYTHIKNKHAQSLQIKSISIKPSVGVRPKATGRKGRPLKKEKDQPIQVEKKQNFQCRICQEEDCACDEDMENHQIDRAITVMQSKVFVEFINCVGAMNVGEQFTWVRNSQDDYHYMAAQNINKMYEQFIKTYDFNTYAQLGSQWADFLSFSSRYWDKDHIIQLYHSIFVIICCSRIEEMRGFLSSHIQFKNMSRCLQGKASEFSRWVQVIKDV